MTAIFFYLGGLALLGLSHFFGRKTTALARVGGAEYEKRKRRKLISQTLLAISLLAFATGIVTQIYSPSGPPVYTPIAAHTATPSAVTNAPSTTHSTLIDEMPLSAAVAVKSDPMNDHFKSSLASSSSSTPLSSSSTSSASSKSNTPTQTNPDLLASFNLMQQHQYNPALEKVNGVIATEPKNAAAYALRGNIYAEKKQWTEAEADYHTAIQIGGENIPLKLNLAEIQYQQKKYGDARTGFYSLKDDAALGDFALYKVFLCDLLAGHEDAAAKELAVFDDAGTNASYYFGNAAWCLYHQKKDEGRTWLTKAAQIYAPYKFKLYSDDLVALVSPKDATTAIVAPSGMPNSSTP